MDETSAEPQGEVSPSQATPPAPVQSNQATSKSRTTDHGEGHEFANPTLNIIHSLSRKASASALSVPSREGTPPPLPPRPQLGLLPSPTQSASPLRPQLVSKATTQLSYSNTEAYGNTIKDQSLPSASSRPRQFPSIAGSSRNESDVEDSASIRSYVPAVDAGGDAESILGEVMGPQEKSEQEKMLLNTLGHRFEDSEAQSMFSPDPDLAEAFDCEFDDIDEMKPDGSNEGQICVEYVEVVHADVVIRSRHAPMACKAEAFPHSLERWKAHLQSTWRRSVDHKLCWGCANYHFVLPVYWGHFEGIHSRGCSLCGHFQRASQSSSHH